MEFIQAIVRAADGMIADLPLLCAALAFILGAIVGSFLNVCIARMPLRQSLLWPGSRCGSCQKAIKWYDNIPLVSYWTLGGRCRACGATFSSRYFWVELFTAIVFAGLFWLEVVENIRHVGEIPALGQVAAVSGSRLLVIWLYHALFLSFLIVVTFTDIDHMQIPLSITIIGTIIGIIGGTLAPWPWPTKADLFLQNAWQRLPFGGVGLQGVFQLPSGLQCWPFWAPASDWFQPGTWPMGLATSLIGAIAGTCFVRLIRLVFGYGLGKEAMGIGDADLMMMIGAFLGWQALIFTMGFGVFFGLLYAITLVLRNKGNELPFGPFLAVGAVVTMIASWWLGAMFQRSFFDAAWLAILTVVTIALAFFLSLSLRMLRLIGQAV